MDVVACSVWAGSCGRWLYNRLKRHGSLDSGTWPLATADNARDIFHYCKLIQGVYEKTPLDLVKSTGYGEQDWIVKLVSKTSRHCPPHYIMRDPVRKEIVVCIRGLNLAEPVNYLVLADTRKGSQPFDGGYVHRGLLNAAEWLRDSQSDTLKEEFENNPDYRLTIVGHSLGAGVASLLTVLLVNHRNLVGNIKREQIQCYCIAPARSMSLNLAIRYSDVINGVVLQDDFLARTSTPIVKIFLLTSLVFTVAVIWWRCVVDTCISERTMLNDDKRLYPPGRLYHITYKEPCCCWCSLLRPCRIKTAIPVEGRFERLVLSSTVTRDHHILNYIEFSNKAIKELEEIQLEAPKPQRMKRLNSLHIVSDLEREDPNKTYATVVLQRTSEGS
ncbi:hypothetical protein SUGI_0268800 [Cryptomeria japonica]|nr:hypothetical protein SUGI_0268800 [Cryptomeria japonica]